MMLIVMFNLLLGENMKKIFTIIICLIIIVISCGCSSEDDPKSALESSNDNVNSEKSNNDIENNEKIGSLCDSVAEIADNFNEQKITKDEVIGSMIQLKDTCTDSSSVCSALKSFGTTITTNTDESRVKVFVEEVKYQCSKILE